MRRAATFSASLAPVDGQFDVQADPLPRLGWRQLEALEVLAEAVEEGVLVEPRALFEAKARHARGVADALELELEREEAVLFLLGDALGRALEAAADRRGRALPGARARGLAHAPSLTAWRVGERVPTLLDLGGFARRRRGCDGRG